MPPRAATLPFEEVDAQPDSPQRRSFAPWEEPRVFDLLRAKDAGGPRWPSAGGVDRAFVRLGVLGVLRPGGKLAPTRRREARAAGREGIGGPWQRGRWDPRVAGDGEKGMERRICEARRTFFPSPLLDVDERP